MDADRIAGDQLAGEDGMRPSPAGEASTRGWERCVLTPYQDQAGFWTVGVGHKMQQSDPRVPITPDEAESLFIIDIDEAGSGVTRLVTVPLAQCQFDALTDFVFNLGEPRLALSTLLRKLNAGDIAGAADQFLVWNKVRDDATGLYVVDPGLVKRCAARRAMFVSGDYSGRP